MDLKDIKLKKYELKTNIEKLLNTFSKETDLCIDDIRIKETANKIDMGNTSKIYFVSVEVSL